MMSTGYTLSEQSAIVMIFVAIVTFIACMNISAPYGKYSTSKGWGILINAKVGWFVMESPNVLVFLLIYATYYNSNNHSSKGHAIHNLPAANLVLLSCFLIHYIHRIFIYPLKLSRQSSPMPISVAVLAFLYCTWNAYTQCYYLIYDHYYNDNDIHSIRFVVGILMFITGFAVNVTSDNELVRLRSVNKGQYSIPSGGLFEYVSCANYAGEIFEWIGYGIAGGSLPSIAFAIYTFSNIGPRGYHHHQYYKKKFENYPKYRKAVIPFIW